jgi:hypothetical protein
VRSRAIPCILQDTAFCHGFQPYQSNKLRGAHLAKTNFQYEKRQKELEKKKKKEEKLKRKSEKGNEPAIGEGGDDPAPDHRVEPPAPDQPIA